MELGYDRPLFILPFDQRSTFEKGLFGFKPPLTEDQTAAIAASKRVVYDGFKLALGKGAPREAAGILVDEQFGASILQDARAQGFITCMPAEKSGQEEFVFEYGDRWRDHIEAFAPTFTKVLVRYNVENDEAMNCRQAARLKELSDYCHQASRHLMFELLVPMTFKQSIRLEGNQRLYDRHLRPSLTIAAIKELQRAGVEPDVWKVEGLDHQVECEALVAVARQGGRAKVSCIVLGRGSDELAVLTWLGVAAAVPGFIGFAIGRTSFWDALIGLRDNAISREAAVIRIADRYAEWIRAFTVAHAG